MRNRSLPHVSARQCHVRLRRRAALEERPKSRDQPGLPSNVNLWAVSLSYEGMPGLDEIDIRILNILARDSRTSVSEIARELGLSRPTVRRRIRRLVDSGIIKSFTIEVNENALRGFQILCSFKADDVEDIVRRLRNLKEVTDIYVTTGERNITCVARVADLKTLESLLEEFKGYGVPFELSIVLSLERRRPLPLIPRFAKLACDYCGKEITGEPLLYTFRGRKYYLCCPTCYREFSKKMRYVSKK